MMAADPQMCRCGHHRDDHLDLEPHCSDCHCEMFHSDAPKTPPRVLAVSGLAGAAAAGPAAVRVVAALDPLVRPLTTMSIDQLLDEARKSAHKRTAALTERIIEQVEDLRNRLSAEQQANRDKAEQDKVRRQAQEDIAALEAKLAAARAKLKSANHTPERAEVVPLPGPARKRARRLEPTACPDCGRMFDGPQALGAHRAHKHGYRRPK